MTHETALDFLAGCRRAECVRARDLRVRAFCRETGRPLPVGLAPIPRYVDRPPVSRRCQFYQHDICRGLMVTDHSYVACTCDCHSHGCSQ